MPPMGPCINVVLLEGGGTFRRWSLVEGNEAIEDVALKGMVAL